MRILTFNHHESYISSLAQTGHTWHVITQYKSLSLPWNTAGAPVPANMRLCHWTEDGIAQALRNNQYDCVVCHTLKNLIWLMPFRPKRVIFIAHIPLFRYNVFLFSKSFLKKMIFNVLRLLMKIEFVAVSEFKRSSWNVPGEVIVLAPQPLPAARFSEPKKIVVVCNHLRERQEELGILMLNQLVERNLPIQVIGNNPGIPFSVHPRTRAEFEELFCGGHIYFYTIKKPYGDGYNTAMLEAMAMGMPVVTVENSSSPIVHQENGLCGHTAEELFQHLSFLLAHPEEVRRMGAHAKQTIANYFSQQQFVEKWKQVLEKSR